VRRVLKLAALIATMSLFLTTAADAHVRIEKTYLKLKVSDTSIKKGTTVHFKGILDSNWSKCYAHRPVKLVRNDVVRRSKKTNDVGIVKWTWNIRASGKWQLWFKGRRWGAHPHDHVCKASTSDTIRIKVTNP
jgi:hypothetical protein